MSNEDENANVARDVVRWDNPDEVLAWIALVRDHILDVVAAGDDATRPFSKRILSRVEARRKIHRAEKDLVRLLAAARRGVPGASELDVAEGGCAVPDRRSD